MRKLDIVAIYFDDDGTILAKAHWHSVTEDEAKDFIAQAHIIFKGSVRNHRYELAVEYVR